MPTRCALYARVSTSDQHCENQLTELRAFCAARGWTITREYVDHGVSGTTEQRPELDALLADARRRSFDVLACWRLDRLGRNLRHLVLMLEDLHALGVSFASLNEASTPRHPQGDSRCTCWRHSRGSNEDASGSASEPPGARQGAGTPHWPSRARRQSCSPAARPRAERARGREGARGLPCPGAQAAFTNPWRLSPSGRGGNTGLFRDPDDRSRTNWFVNT